MCVCVCVCVCACLSSLQRCSLPVCIGCIDGRLRSAACSGCSLRFTAYALLVVTTMINNDCRDAEHHEMHDMVRQALVQTSPEHCNAYYRSSGYTRERARDEVEELLDTIMPGWDDE